MPRELIIDGKPVDPRQVIIQYIGSWHIVSQINVSRAWIKDGVGVKAGGLRNGDRLVGGQGKIELEYFSGGGAGGGHSGVLTIDTVGAVVGGFRTRVFADDRQLDEFGVTLSEKRDLTIWFGKDLAGLATVKTIRAVMNVNGTDHTILDVPLDGVAQALVAMRLGPDYNYNVLGVGRPPAGGGSSSPPGGCYLTTACCDLVGLNDDCFELTALRRFRDGAMAKSEEGRRAVSSYYDLAPAILAEMRRRGEERRLLGFYFSHILPSAMLARLGFRRLPYRIYRDLTRRLVARYLPQRTERLG